jgi:hypothetical protein
VVVERGGGEWEWCGGSSVGSGLCVCASSAERLTAENKNEYTSVDYKL